MDRGESRGLKSFRLPLNSYFLFSAKAAKKQLNGREQSASCHSGILGVSCADPLNFKEPQENLKHLSGGEQIACCSGFLQTLLKKTVAPFTGFVGSWTTNQSGSRTNFLVWSSCGSVHDLAMDHELTWTTFFRFMPIPSPDCIHDSWQRWFTDLCSST